MSFAIHAIITPIAVNIIAGSACCITVHLIPPQEEGAPAADCCVGLGNPDCLALILREKVQDLRGKASQT